MNVIQEGAISLLNKEERICILVLIKTSWQFLQQVVWFNLDLYFSGLNLDLA